MFQMVMLSSRKHTGNPAVQLASQVKPSRYRDDITFHPSFAGQADSYFKFEMVKFNSESGKSSSVKPTALHSKLLDHVHQQECMGRVAKGEGIQED